LTVVPADRVREFLDPLPIEKMWGVGKVTQEALARINVRTFRDLSQLPLAVLERNFGKHGLKMHLLSMGMDERDVVPEHAAKSIGHEQTFSTDILDKDAARTELLSLADKVARRMRRHGVTGRTVTLKVKYDDFEQITRAGTLIEPTDDGPEIYSTACRLLGKTSVGKRPVRLLGISLSQLASRGTGSQLLLFDESKALRRKGELHAALDSLSEKYGEGSIRPGRLLGEEESE
jgi:DNA polymerase-4